MNIAIIGPAHPLRGGGISTFNERLAEVLQEQGHTVVIYSFSLQYPSFLFPGKSQFTNEPAPKGLTIYSLINSVNPFNWFSVGGIIKKAKHDLVIVRYWIPFMGPALGTILRVVRRNKHTRILCIADNVIPHEKRPGDSIFTKYFIKPIDSFVTMSRDVLQDLKKLTNKPAVFNPHPLYDNFGPLMSKEEACKALGLDPGEKYLLFFGFIRKYKGLDILLEALGDQRLKDAGVKLIVAGEFYSDREEYEDLIDQYDLKDQVHLFTEFIPNNEVRYYFCACDLIVLPYRNATQSGISQVAYHFEKPMVVSNVGGLPEFVPDGKVGYITEPEAGSVANAILKFFEPNSIPDLQQNLLEEKKKYTWDTFTRSLLEVAIRQ
jgi:glycosyltransferase involved in cell wall biosynthesis